MNCRDYMLRDALALLKDDETQLQYRDDHIAMYQAEVKRLEAMLEEQEAVEPRRIDGKHNHFIKCGNCNYDLVTGYMFCPHCGKAVKWE